MIPYYANLKFTNTSPAAQVTANKAQILPVKNEIKYLFKRKDILNHELYTTHLKAANEWGNLWSYIQDSTHESTNEIIEKKYQSLDKKSKKLVQTQNQKPTARTEFYPRVVNKTEICFTEEELKLLNYGLKYNINYKRKHWLSNLALEADSAITRLP